MIFVIAAGGGQGQLTVAYENALHVLKLTVTLLICLLYANRWTSAN